MEITESVLNALNLAVRFWWAYLPLILFIVLINTWASYTRAKFLGSLNWVLLEIKFPQELATSFKAAEQLFAGLHGIFIKPLTWDERFFKGKLPEAFSLEITGGNGEVRFYIRTLESYRNLVESNIYAQYPEVEIRVVSDYVNDVTSMIPNDDYDLWGMELELTKENFYPIRTYTYFEEVGQFGKEKKIIDPLSSLSEILGSLKLNEHLWIQFLIRPVGADWTKPAEGALDKLLGREKTEGEEVPRLKPLAPGERSIAEAIGLKISKFGFETTLRFVYVGHKDIFSTAYGAAVSGAFKQFGTQNLNGFKANIASIPIVLWPFKFMVYWPLKLIPYPGAKKKAFRKKKRLFRNYKERSFTITSKPFILNTEELATVYHFPSLEVKAPLLERIEAKKGTPPAGLPQ